MDTTERIYALCDADGSSVNSIVAEARKWVTVGQLQTEFTIQNVSKKVMVAFYKGFSSILRMATEQFEQMQKQMAKSFFGKIEADRPMKKLAEYFELIEDLRENDIPELPKWRINTRHNDYPKVHHLPLLRRMRCRWRQRESHRQLNGLSLCPDIDEDLVCA